jgi:hypothetical protein
MSVKDLVSLTTLPTENEQTGTTPKTVTATFTSRMYPELSNFQTARIYVEVTAISGSGASLAVDIQEQNPMTGNWVSMGTPPGFTAITTVSLPAPTTLTLGGLNYRVVYTIAGTTPSVTFTCCAVPNSEEAIT